MNAILPLHFDHFDVRMLVREGEPWWVLNDVCAVLEIRNPRDAARRLEEYQKGVGNTDTLGGRQELVLVNEPGIYALTLNSRKSEAKAFARWLFTEVLPAIRRFGTYPPPDLSELIESDRWDGYADTLGARFRQERLLWEERNGRPFAGVAPVFTKQMVAAIERGEGKIRTAERLWTLIHAEFDVLYVLTGRRQFSSQERRSIYRARELAPNRPLLTSG